ncbi:hypothetical protein CFAEC_00790 [Corynebacterium faecale]|uniref:hypothetical protein n=1 Tax=Corynebacterium faecale TaxID=1758466 RepID=UPI0025B318FD|nr:hypothetical protein [Corynebacterium faecale]WJY91026.1 hypothetical protein CFAEC_00790 [Corynebacterium faecale]
MKRWNITLITGLAGVLFFALISLVFAPMDLAIGMYIAFILLTVVAIIAAVVNAREASESTWRTWVGLVGALLIATPGVCSVLANLLISSGDAMMTLANTLATVGSVGMLILLPVGIVMCLVAGFSRFHEARRVAA